MASLCSRARGYPGCEVVTLQGELDITDAAELSARLVAVASREPWVIVDLNDVTFIDCSTLGLLVRAREQARLAGGDVLLAGPRAGAPALDDHGPDRGVLGIFWRRAGSARCRGVPGR
ncbi:MAG: STAS domain-containing protein [Streptosporangiaceae bacterium]